MYIIWLVVSIDACFHISLFKTIGILNPNWRAKRNHQRVNFAFCFFHIQNTQRDTAGGSSQTFRDHSVLFQESPPSKNTIGFG